MRRLYRHLLIVGVLFSLAGCAGSQTTVPSSFKGFVGEVQGQVQSVHENAFTLQIKRITEIREDNQSPRPGVAEGLEFVVYPRRVVDQRGQSHPIIDHSTFINSLSPQQTITVRVRHLSGKQLEMLATSDS